VTTLASHKRRRHTPDQIIRKLAEGSKLLGAGQELADVCRHLENAESTWHRWFAQVPEVCGRRVDVDTSRAYSSQP
jgi:putative transposase